MYTIITCSVKNMQQHFVLLGKKCDVSEQCFFFQSPSYVAAIL